MRGGIIDGYNIPKPNTGWVEVDDDLVQLPSTLATANKNNPFGFHIKNSSNSQGPIYVGFNRQIGDGPQQSRAGVEIDPGESFFAPSYNVWVFTEGVAADVYYMEF